MVEVPSVRLICCGDLDDYARVAAGCSRERGEAAVLGRPPLARGFGPGVTLLDAAGWEAESPAPSPAPSPARLCVSLDEPSCRAIARCLAEATGRRLALIDAAGWVEQLEALLTPDLESLTFVLPLWSGGSGEPSPALDPTWLGRALAFARTHARALASVPWGILVAGDPGRLSLVVAKALLQPQIIAAYADAPALLFASASAEEFDCRLPVLTADAGDTAGGGLRLIDRRHLRDASARTLARRAASLLYFRGHGRFYCGLEGHLCGARPLALAPETPIERCLDGLSCASPHDGSYDAQLLAFPRIDPRSYDAPLMVLDSCAAGGWSSPDWAQGVPSLAIHALSGAPSAVVCGDYVTITSPLSHVEVFAVLYSSANLGEAVSRLNRARPRAVAEFPYFLLGDPELAVGPTRWPSWCADPLELSCERTPIAQRIRARVGVGHPFVRVPLGIEGAHAATTIVSHADPNLDLHTLHLLASDPPELWVTLERPAGPDADAPAILDILTVPAPRLPPGLLEAAITTPLRVRAWQEALTPGAASLLAAAAHIEQVEALCAQTRGRALQTDPRDLLGSVPAARQLWLRAHHDALAHALTLAPKGLWPFSLWKAGNYEGSTSADACPHCGASPTLHRDYDSGPALRRRQWECVACALILDRPLMPMPALSLTMPTSIAPGQTITAELRFDNDGPTEHTFAVAGALLLDRKGHGVPAPPPFVFELGPGATHSETVEFHLDGPPDIAHRYYARALLLLNGVWMMATRLVTVRDA